MPGIPADGGRIATATIRQNLSSTVAWSITTRYVNSSGSSATLALRANGAFIFRYASTCCFSGAAVFCDDVIAIFRGFA